MPRSPFRVRKVAILNMLALVGYALLTLALTWPLAKYFGRAIPGDGFDGWQNFWNLWWVKQAVLVEHTHPWFTDLLYYPTGVGLLFHTLNAFNGFTFLPIQLAWGLFPAYNAVVIFSFAVGGLGAYLLARHVLGPRSSRLAAFGAGVIFTFAPYHIAHLLGHMQLITLEWLPFFALYLLRTVDALILVEGDGRVTSNEKRVRANARRVARNALLAAFFLVLVTLSDWYYLLYALLFTGVVFVWVIAVVIGRRWKAGSAGGDPAHPTSSWLSGIGRLVIAIAGIWLLWAVAISPLLVPMVREARQSSFMVPDPQQSRTYSADLLAFFTPQQFHPLWGDRAAAAAKVFTATVSENQVFAGYTVLALALLGVVAAFRRSPPATKGGVQEWRARRATAGLWLLTLGFFFLLSLGPVLHIAGSTALLPGGREVPLPYAWLVRIVPFMNISRSVSRFDAMMMLALAVLAALGLDWFSRRGRAGRAAALAAVGLVLFEFLPIPYPMSFPDTPAWYRTLAADPRPGSVLVLPMEWDRPNYLLDQTTHGKPMAAGYISREDPRTLVARAPVLLFFRHLGPDIIAFDLAGQGKQALNDLGVRWVVLDRYQMPENPGNPERSTRAITTAAAAQIFGQQTPVYEDDRLTVYEAPGEALTAPYLILGAGWAPFDRQRHTRAFTGDASVIVRAPAAGQVTLRIGLAPGSAPLDLPQGGEGYVVQIPVQPGDNPVRLRARDPGGRVEVESLSVGPGIPNEN